MASEQVGFIIFKMVFSPLLGLPPQWEFSERSTAWKEGGTVGGIFAESQELPEVEYLLRAQENGIKKRKEMNKSACKSICVHLKRTEINISEAETECLW